MQRILSEDLIDTLLARYGSTPVTSDRRMILALLAHIRRMQNRRMTLDPKTDKLLAQTLSQIHQSSVSAFDAYHSTNAEQSLQLLHSIRAEYRAIVTTLRLFVTESALDRFLRHHNLPPS